MAFSARPKTSDRWSLLTGRREEVPNTSASRPSDVKADMCSASTSTATDGSTTVRTPARDFVVEKTGQPVGRIVMDLGRYDWRVSEVEIHRLARGKGIGTDLLRSFQGTAAQMRIPITLSVAEVDTRVHWFYHRLGFDLLAKTSPSLELIWLPPGHPGIQHLPPQILPAQMRQGGAS